MFHLQLGNRQIKKKKSDTPDICRESVPQQGANKSEGVTAPTGLSFYFRSQN